MLLLDFAAKVIGSIAWPATMLTIIIFLRKPIRDLLPFLERLKYKDFELSFRRQLQEALESSDIREVTGGTESDLEKIAHTSPRSSIMEAWRQLELAAEARLEELKPKIQQIKLGPDGALGYFQYTGTFIPRTKKTLSKLRALRNQAVHLPDSVLSTEDARSYVQVAETIKKQIQSFTTIPQFKLTQLTLLILEYNHLLDTRKYDYITIKDIHREIKNRSVLRYIAKEAADEADLSMYLDVEGNSDFENQYAQQLQSIYGGYAGQERRKWGVENLGLCLLVAWTNEIIQTGSGWHPNEDRV
jgi:hypothetical protein